MTFSIDSPVNNKRFIEHKKQILNFTFNKNDGTKI